MSSGADAVSQSPLIKIKVNLCWNIKIIVVRLLKIKKKLLHKFIEFVLFVQQEN